MIPQAVIRNPGNGSICYAIKGLQRFWQMRKKQLIWRSGRLWWQPCERAEPEGDWPCCPARRGAELRNSVLPETGTPFPAPSSLQDGIPPGECRDPQLCPWVLVQRTKHAQIHPFGLSWRSSASMRWVCLLADGVGHLYLTPTERWQATLPFITQSTSILLLPSALWFVTRTSTIAGCELATAEMVWYGGIRTVPGTLHPHIWLGIALVPLCSTTSTKGLLSSQQNITFSFFKKVILCHWDTITAFVYGPHL